MRKLARLVFGISGLGGVIFTVVSLFRSFFISPSIASDDYGFYVIVVLALAMVTLAYKLNEPGFDDSFKMTVRLPFWGWIVTLAGTVLLFVLILLTDADKLAYLVLVLAFMMGVIATLLLALVGLLVDWFRKR